MRPKNAWSLEIPILFCFHSLYKFFYINDLHISPFLQTILPRAFIFGVKFYKLLSRELMPLLFHFQFKTYFKYKIKITFLNLNLLLFKVNPAIDPCNNRYIKGSTYPYQFWMLKSRKVQGYLKNLYYSSTNLLRGILQVSHRYIHLFPMWFPCLE